MSLVVGYKGSVNRWECDENDHLNVRFFVKHMTQALASGLIELGVIGTHDLATLASKIGVQHMRFIAEARIATPMTGTCGYIGAFGERQRFVTELRHSVSGALLAAFVHDLDLPGRMPASVPLPEHAGSRGVGDADLVHATLSLQQAKAAGFQLVGRGVVAPDDCVDGGRLPIHLHMGRASDSMPNLWGLFQTPEELVDGTGGLVGTAVVEYRMRYHRLLGAHQRFEVVSALLGLGSKTTHMAHMIFDADEGQCCVSCEVVGVVMDLDARAATLIPEDRRARMLPYVID